MQRLLTVFATGPVACSPPAEDAGQVDPTEPGSAGDDANGTDGGATDTDGGATDTDAADGATGMDGIPPPLDPSIEWSLELEPDTTIFQMIRSPDGVVLVLQTDDLVEPSVDLGTFGFSVIDGSRTPSGNVVLHVTGDDYQLYEIGADGTGSLTLLEELTVLVGRGDDLTLMSLGNQGLGIRPYDGGEVVPVSIPGHPFSAFLVDRRERFAFTFMAEEPEGGSSVHVFEFGEDGVVLRELVLPHMLYPYAQPSALAVGEDDAIYVAIVEGDGEGVGARFLHRIAPL